MSLTVNDFQRLAAAQFFQGKNILLRSDGPGDDAVALQTRSSLRVSVSKSAREANKAVMNAFRNALREQYGIFGEHAFEQVLGARARSLRALRAADVKATLAALCPGAQLRLAAEIERQMEVNPQFNKTYSGLDRLQRAQLRQDALMTAREGLSAQAGLARCRTAADVSALAQHVLAYAKEHLYTREEIAARDIAAQQNRSAPPAAPTQTPEVNNLVLLEQPPAPNEATGLRRLQQARTLESRGVTYRAGETSVEDRQRAGLIGPGMRVNHSRTNPVLLDSIKANGVEPGFLYRNDWSRGDTASLLTDILSGPAREAVERDLNQLTDAAPTTVRPREDFLLAGLRVGRAHSAAMAFAAEFVLRDALAQQADSPLLAALHAKFPTLDPQTLFDNPARFAEVKRTLFAEFQSAIMAYGRSNRPYANLPIFQHFTERHIAKLDYNESDRLFASRAGSKGHFYLPDRTAYKSPGAGNLIKNTFYHAFRRTTATDASVGAAAEAFANDLTRLLGVPAQELSLIEGQYSDGKPKLMLEATFAKGYADAENVLHDGYMAQTAPDGTLRSIPIPNLGAYKAVFLLLADRDAVGSHGQNKGFINAPDGGLPTFFAIDPGHSLEGNAAYLSIQDDLSFTDTKRATLEKRFLNYSIFDDTLRSEKFAGILKLRELRDTGALDGLLNDYTSTFTPNPDTPDQAHLATAIRTRLQAMHTEASEQLTRILDTFAPLLELYDTLGRGPQALQAIDAIENLEKLTSDTSLTSPNGSVRLNHLRILPNARLPWTAHADPATGLLTLSTRAPIPPAQAPALLERLQALYPALAPTQTPTGHLTLTLHPTQHPEHLALLTDEARVIEYKDFLAAHAH